MRKIIQKNNGFTALISSIIISAILLIIAVDTGFVSFYNSFNILDSESKEVSSGLADACLDLALLRITQNPTYIGNDTSVVSENTCFIGLVLTNGSKKTFNIKGVYRDAHTNLKVTVDGTNFTVLEVEEILTI